MTGRAEHLNSTDILTLLVQTFALAALCVSGTLLMFSNAPCNLRVTGAFIGVASGCLLFLWVAVAEIARYVSERVSAKRGQA
jgi:hypothetical protein